MQWMSKLQKNYSIITPKKQNKKKNEANRKISKDREIYRHI